MAMHSCGCCSLKTGCRLGALWTMVEALIKIGLLVASGLLAKGNIISIVATCFFVLIFCAGWVLLSGIYRNHAAVLYVWSFLYILFVMIRVVLLGFMLAAYVQYVHNQPVTFEIVYLADGTVLSQSSIDASLPYLLGCICGLGVSIVLSAWILVGVIYLAVQMRRQHRKCAQLEYYDDY